MSADWEQEQLPIWCETCGDTLDRCPAANDWHYRPGMGMGRNAGDHHMKDGRRPWASSKTTRTTGA